MDTNIPFKYAFLKSSRIMYLHQSSETKIDGDAKGVDARQNDIIIIDDGTLLKVHRGSGSRKNLVVVQILDYINNDPLYENLYECPKYALQPVDEKLWSFVINILDRGQYMLLLKDENHCRWLMNLKANDIVRLSGAIFNKPKANYFCIIRYIGPVAEIFPVGHFFGLEILEVYGDDLPDVDSSLVNKYIKCDSGFCIFATANWISKIPTEERKSYLVSDFSISSTFGTVYDKVMSMVSKPSLNVASHDSDEVQKSKETREKRTEHKGILKTKPKDQMVPSSRDGPKIIRIETMDTNADLAKVFVFENGECPRKTNDLDTPNNRNIDGKKQQHAAYEQPDNYTMEDYTSLKELPGTDLGLGCLVQVNEPDKNEPLYGVIRWVGIPPCQNDILIGIELENDCINEHFLTTNGGFNGIQLFKCPPGRGIFVKSDLCSSDTRFLAAGGCAVGNGKHDNKAKILNGFHDEQQTFGHMDCPVVLGAIPPIKCTTLNDLEELCGKFKGIQGHHNSCYLDVTLFSMFAFTPVFDSILYRPPEENDILHYTEVQSVLRDEIVNPLRKHMFVRADRVMKLRQLLDKLSSVSGLMSEEKDPEEFLNCLLSQILKAEPFLKLNSGHDAYYYQLFVEKDERLSFPSVQQLFEQSFYASDIKLKEVPPYLIIQMPRFGKNFKTYPRILPSQILDVTDIIDDSPRQCSICGKLAEYECRDCFNSSGFYNGIGLESTSFCEPCLAKVHTHAKRANHTHRKLCVPPGFMVMDDTKTVPRLFMELFAVLCIETSHYVAFVKSGSDPDAPWCFFDSMADRKGERNGYNIPQMVTVPDLPKWLSDEGAHRVNEMYSNDKKLPEHARRLFCDAYMCMYKSPDVMMYR